MTAYDPKGNQKVRELNLCPGVHLADSALAAAQDAGALVLATEWPEFSDVDFTEVRYRMHTPIVFDGRNLFDPTTMRDLGFQYFAVERLNLFVFFESRGTLLKAKIHLQLPLLGC